MNFLDNNENIKSLIKLINDGKSWKEIARGVDNNDLFIVCYNAILAKASLIEFKEMIEDIYKRASKFELSCFFSRFFDYKSTDITLEGYKKKLNTNIFNETYYVFYDRESKDIELDKNNLPYLLIMLNSISEDNVCCLHEAKFTYYLANTFSENINELKPIFNIKNQAFKINEKGNFLNVNISFVMNILDELLFEKKVDSKTLQKSIDMLKKNIDNFQEIVKENIFNTNDSGDKVNFKINLGLFNIAEHLNINLFHLFNNEYKKIRNKNHFASYDGIDANISVYFKNYNFSKIDFNSLDLKKDIRENYIYYSFLINAIKNKNSFDEIYLNKETITYLLNVFAEAKCIMSSNKTNKDQDYKMLLIDINFEYENNGLKEFIDAYILNETLEHKSKKNAINKI